LILLIKRLKKQTTKRYVREVELISALEREEEVKSAGAVAV